MEKTFPAENWTRITPQKVGFHLEKLRHAKYWLDDQPDQKRYRVVVIRHGYLVAEWNWRYGPNRKLPLASVAKSVLACILGIAIQEGVIESADDPLEKYYPEAFAVPKGAGPKPDRYVLEKDRAITLRQLITNTSGYMKPGEDPGKVFHYQTFGMNVLAHAISKAYGYYDIATPEGSLGLKVLIRRMIAQPIQASWGYQLENFDLPEAAKINIFGYYEDILSNALDMARLGWLWCNWGNWNGRQIVPEAWLRQAVQTAPDILAHSPKEFWKYGHGFWSNDHSLLHPDLPSDSFAARGAGNQYIWVCPSLDLVVVLGPGAFTANPETDLGILPAILAALEG